MLRALIVKHIRGKSRCKAKGLCALCRKSARKIEARILAELQ
jgi:hypothetical protein